VSGTRSPSIEVLICGHCHGDPIRFTPLLIQPLRDVPQGYAQVERPTRSRDSEILPLRFSFQAEHFASRVCGNVHRPKEATRVPLKSSAKKNTGAKKKPSSKKKPSEKKTGPKRPNDKKTPGDTRTGPEKVNGTTAAGDSKTLRGRKSARDINVST
jgi:hypothetical protein